MSSIVYIEIPAPHFEQTKNFYQEVFGWKVKESDLDGSPYAMFETLEGDYGLTGGGFNPNLKSLDRGSLSVFLGTEDIPKALDKIQKAGGEIIQEKTEIGGGYGFYAEYKDPSGNILSLWAKS
ncbi:MAG: VOC family protein [Bacteriovoracaceae bacterium]